MVMLTWPRPRAGCQRLPFMTRRRRASRQLGGSRRGSRLVSHDAHFHGARCGRPAVARSLVRDHGVALTILLGGPGELSRDFERIAPTEIVAGDFADFAAA